MASDKNIKFPSSKLTLKLEEVMECTGLKKATIYDRMDVDSDRYDPTFPKQFKLGGTRAVGWDAAEVVAWQAQQKNNRVTKLPRASKQKKLQIAGAKNKRNAASSSDAVLGEANANVLSEASASDGAISPPEAVVNSVLTAQEPIAMRGQPQPNSAAIAPEEAEKSAFVTRKETVVITLSDAKQTQIVVRKRRRKLVT